MKSKMFEIRDRGTTIPVIAIKTDGDNIKEDKHFWRGGWGPTSIILVKHNGGTEVEHDPFAWQDNRTMFEAHKYIKKHFDELEDFAVIDIEYIEEMFNLLIDRKYFTEEELTLITSINETSIETLNDAIYARYGYRNITQLMDSEGE